MMRRLAVGVALAAALTLPLAGCGTSSGGGTDGGSDAAPSPKPAEVLATAVTKTSGVSLKLVLAGDKAEENLQGEYDNTNKIGSFAQSGSDPMKIVVTGSDLYLSGLADLAGKTMHMDITKLPTKNAMALFADPLAAFTLLPAATEVNAASGGSYSGTIDLTKAQGATPGAKKFLEYVTAAAADKANAVKFLATVDGEGYVTKFKATFPGLDEGKDSEYDVTFSDFGAAVTIAKPSGPDVFEAPASSYEQ